MADKRSLAIFLPLPFPDLGFSWNLQEGFYPAGGLFASVGQAGLGFGVPPNSLRSSTGSTMKVPGTDLYMKYAPPEFGGYCIGGSVGIATPESVFEASDIKEEEEETIALVNKKRKKAGGRIRIRIGNPHLRRLVSGAIAGAVSRTCVAPLETIKTHLMVGSSGNSIAEVFQSIMQTEGWKGLFRGNFVNVIRVAPSKAIELFAYDTAQNILNPKDGEVPMLPIPSSLVAGAFAGFSSTLCTYPLELLKTRITVQRGVYDDFLHAFVKILREGGPSELYRGLIPSLIGVVPYAATNYFAYESLKKLHRKVFKKEEIGNISILLIGSAAGVISSSATFPLEIARKRMQLGAVGGRQVYKNMLHALLSILEKEGVGGLYRGLGPSYMKLMPAAGISFMCYEACKKIFTDTNEDA